MTIVSNRAHLFGLSHYGVTKNNRFACGVSTAPEGVFKSYSIVVSSFDPRLSWDDAYKSGALKLEAKFLLHPRLSKEDRAKVHNIVLSHLGIDDAENVGLASCLFFALDFCKGIIIEHVFSPAISAALEKVATMLEEEAAALEKVA